LSQRIVTFTTDFGLDDPWVGTMKGVVLSINPEVVLVDICNAVQSFDILDGAITLAQAYNYYPAGSVHVVVIDPGVGTVRRPIVADTGRHVFVAPDNGVLSFVYAREEGTVVRHITAEHYFLQPVSQTFHGRDVFACVAGWISKGIDLSKLGDEITDYVRFAIPKPQIVDNVMKAVVLKVDKFGNLITNVTPQDLPQLFQPEPGRFTIFVGKAEINRIVAAYGNGNPGEPFAILGSTGFLEIAANRASASRLVGAAKGSEVKLRLL
jgi:hypothetical protein